jgi:hypothetical protein
MINGNHGDTLNHDINTLQQKHKDEDDLIVIKANPNYQINEHNTIHE